MGTFFLGEGRGVEMCQNFYALEYLAHQTLTYVDANLFEVMALKNILKGRSRKERKSGTLFFKVLHLGN